MLRPMPPSRRFIFSTLHISINFGRLPRLHPTGRLEKSDVSEVLGSVIEGSRHACFAG